MQSASILLIDDEDKLRGLLSRLLELEGYQMFGAANAKEGLKILEKEDIKLVLSDVKLPDANGVELTQKIKSLYPHIEIIVLTAYGTIADGVKAIKNGAFDYIIKGDDNDKIIPLVSRALEKIQLQTKVKTLTQKINKKFGFESIIGNSRAISEAKILSKKVAPTDTTVLLLGETGTGKEVFAQAIHYESERKENVFVAINCSAFSREMLESELFGYKAGAFTGAQKDKRGLLDEAHLGTIFLDEIGEMSLDLQAKILRVLETKEFYKVGDSKPTKVNVRIIAATNRDLLKEAEEGHFRLDLYYRLSVFNIKLPSLNERLDDINLLTKYFLNTFSNNMNKKNLSFNEDFLNKLKNHNWKGNIRELKNIIERSVIISENLELTANDLPFDFLFQNENNKSTDLSLATVEKKHILKILEFTKNNKTESSRLLGIGLTTLYRKLEEYNIQ